MDEFAFWFVLYTVSDKLTRRHQQDIRFMCDRFQMVSFYNDWYGTSICEIASFLGVKLTAQRKDQEKIHFSSEHMRTPPTTAHNLPIMEEHCMERDDPVDDFVLDGCKAKVYINNIIPRLFSFCQQDRMEWERGHSELKSGGIQLLVICLSSPRIST